MSRQFRSYYVVLRSSRGVLRGWIVTASSKRDARKHAKRQVTEAFGGRWLVREARVATQAELNLAWSSFR